MKHILLSSILVLAVFLINAQNPTKWRGPNGNGLYPDKGLLAEWPATGPEILWHYDKCGIGFASPAFANGKIYTAGIIDSKGYIIVLSEDGKLIKQIEYGKDWEESFPGTRSTPVIVGNLIYYYSGFGQLICIEDETWTVKWSKNILEEYQGENIRWGVTETLLIDGDILYVTPGGKTHNVIALNRLTGEKVWSSAAHGEVSAYCSPLLITLPTRKILVTMTASHIFGIDTKTGLMLWSEEQPNQWSVHANTPIYYDNGIFYMSGYGKGCGRLNLNADGSAVTKAWYTDQLDGRMGGAVIIDGFVFASGDKQRGWQALDFKTGERKFYSTELFQGTVISADNKLIGYTEKGDLFLARPNTTAFEVISKTKVELGDNQHWAHPAIHNGILYLRHGNALIAYKIK